MDSVDELYVDKDLSLLKKITVVIPTYNRNYYLSRCLWYHSHFPFGEIIVADSSPEEKKVVNRETVRKLIVERGVNIRYLEYPLETDKYGRDIMRKWGDAVQHVETEYSQICTDKEFLIPMTLCKCVSFLDEHEDHDIATGSNYYIRSSKSGEIQYLETFPGRSLSFDYPDPLSRLLAYPASLPTVHVSSMKRSHVHKRTYNKLFESGIDDLRFGEFGFELFSVISSRSIYFPDNPHICRDNTQLPNRIKLYTHESSTSRYPWLDEYIQSGLYADYLDRLSSCLTHEYLSLSSSAMTAKDVQYLMRIRIQNLLKNRDFFTNPLSKEIFNFGLLILEHLPTWTSTCVRRILNRPIRFPLADISYEFQIINQILIRTLHLHEEDKAISLLNP